MPPVGNSAVSVSREDSPEKAGRLMSDKRKPLKKKKGAAAPGSGAAAKPTPAVLAAPMGRPKDDHKA
jgi:hypothetical protein